MGKKKGEKMKIKPIYLYLVSFVIIIAIIVLFTSEKENPDLPTEDVIPHSEMPLDDTHKNFQGAPGSGNVTPEFREKMKNLKKSYEQNPGDSAIAVEYARLLAAAHRSDEALDVYQKLINYYPNNSDFRLELATVYYSLQQFDKAKEEILLVIEKEPDAPDVKYNLGAIEFALGNEEKAKEIWNKIIDESPGSEAAEYARRSLENIN